MIFNQEAFNIRCEWGEHGIDELAPISDAVIIVDVMSFSTCVSVAVSRGVVVFPYARRDAGAHEYASSLDAELAGPRSRSTYSLSPTSLLTIPAETRLVLPSPNGSSLSLRTGACPTFAGCLRNARAVAMAALLCGPRVAVIPAGERWKGDGSLRFAFEDLVGAGAIIRCLSGTLSPEARLALAAFNLAIPDLPAQLNACASGKELIALGYEDDLPLIAEVDADNHAPRLIEGAYRRNDPS